MTGSLWVAAALVLLPPNTPGLTVPAPPPEVHRADPATTQEEAAPPQRPRFGGPDSVGIAIAEDAEPKRPLVHFDFLQPYFAFKDNVADRTGLTFSLDYSSVYLAASESLGARQSGSGIVRLFGSWDLVGGDSGNSGAVVFKLENRHGYSEVAPSAFSFELGYAGLVEPPFSDQQTRLTNLYWRQRIGHGRVAIVGGFLDATDYVDVFALASPWMGFMNFAFSTGSATIPVPNDALLGFAIAGMVTDNIYVIGGIADSNADPTDPFAGFDSFFNVREYFKHFEIGWTSSQDRIYLDNLHVTLWQNDEREEAGVLEGWGANFSFSYYLNERWMPFLRAGYADDGGSLLQKSLSTGIGYQRFPGRDLLAFGFNWGQPNESTFVPGLDDQYSLELFYRLQLADRLAITPDIQMIMNPVLNPEADSIWVFGLRARLAL
jgi:porin